MKLKREDTDLFYRLYWSLLFYVNRKYSVIKDLKEPILMDENPRKVVELTEILYSNMEHIDSFVLENPFNFNNEELDIIRGWKKHLKGKFLIVAHLKKYSVFMTNDKESMVYGVLGLYDEIEDIVPLFIPSYVNTVLLPFKGQIIYHGFIMSYNINIVGGKAHNIVYTKRLNTSSTPQVHIWSITSCTLFSFRTSLRIFLNFHRFYTQKF
jgi:hypothetical protein